MSSFHQHPEAGETALLEQPTPPEATPAPEDFNSELLAFAHQLREDLTRLRTESQFAVDEMLTKVSILRQELRHLHRYNPIEHVGSRVKSTESILKKTVRCGLEPTVEAIRAGIHDIAGVRITCSFIADTYRILDTLTSQTDVRVIRVKDYIAQPKSNGYKSLHALVELPVFLTSGAVPVTVEVQIRTIAMDFWASLEHKIYYKYDQEVPADLVGSLLEAAKAAEHLDRRMEQLHTQVHGAEGPSPAGGVHEGMDQELLQLWKRAHAPADVEHSGPPVTAQRI
jgi:putative GTP pyrophosphokinase